MDVLIGLLTQRLIKTVYKDDAYYLNNDNRHPDKQRERLLRKRHRQQQTLLPVQ